MSTQDPSSFTTLPASAFVRVATVRALSALPDTTRQRLIAEGRFPAPVRLADRAVGWRVGELRTWLGRPESYFIPPLEAQQVQETTP